MPIIAVDFDGVLHDSSADARRPGFKMGPPMAFAADSMRCLYGLGHELVIYTCRAADGKAASTEHVEKWLDYFDIPYDSVTALKPMADVYVDDKGLHFTSWDQALPEILTRVLDA